MSRVGRVRLHSVAKARVESRRRCALAHRTTCTSERACADVYVLGFLFGFRDCSVLLDNAMTLVAGRSSCRSSSRFAAGVAIWKNTTPVILPPGRARLATRPYRTGSSPLTNTIGVLAAPALAASAAAGPPPVTTTESGLCLSSAISDGSRSVVTLGPSDINVDVAAIDEAVLIQPRTEGRHLVGAWLRRSRAWRNPITGIAGCCDQAASRPCRRGAT